MVTATIRIERDVTVFASPYRERDEYQAPGQTSWIEVGDLRAVDSETGQPIHLTLREKIEAEAMLLAQYRREEENELTYLAEMREEDRREGRWDR